MNPRVNGVLDKAKKPQRSLKDKANFGGEAMIEHSLAKSKVRLRAYTTG
jgi:hypothetical protein